MNIIKKIACFSILIGAISLLNACSTIKGFGKDVSQAGHDIQKAAR